MANASCLEPTSIELLIGRRNQSKAEIRQRIQKSFDWFSRVSKLWPFIILAVVWQLFWCTAVVCNIINDSITSHEYKQGRLELKQIHGVYAMLVTFTVVGAILGGINFALHLTRAICDIIHYCKPQWQRSSFEISSSAPENDLYGNSTKGFALYKKWFVSLLELLQYYLSLLTPGNLIKMCSHTKTFYAACLSVDVFVLMMEAAPQSLIAYLGFDIIHQAPTGYNNNSARIEVVFETFCLIQCVMAAISFSICLCIHGCKGWLSGLGFFGFFAAFLVLRCVIPALNCQSTGYCPT